MAINLKTTKLLWGRSGNRCAICRTELIEDAIDESDDDSIVGEMAHIIARKETFTRGDYDSLSEEERDRYSNLILLCRKHHKVIDDQPGHYTVIELRRLKFFCTADALELVRDRSWLTKMTNTINQHWHRQNGRKKINSVSGSQNGRSCLIDLYATATDH